jgi:hypothetical protein
MPIPYRETALNNSADLAAYLRVIQEDGSHALRGGLFFVNSYAEPIEFCFSRVSIPRTILWRPGDSRRKAVRELCKSMFSACSSTPALLICRAEEVPPLVFLEDIHVEVPVARVSSDLTLVVAPNEVEESLSNSHSIYWTPSAPEEGSLARSLLQSLSQNNLALEPFDRAARGIEEAFASGQ